MLETFCKFIAYILVFVSLWFVSYILPAFVVGIITWDKTNYFAATTNPIYALVFGTVGLAVSASCLSYIDNKQLL